MTKGDVTKLLGIENETFDYALPQPWLDEAVKRTGHPYHSITGQFVWMYDGEHRFAGRPFALTGNANLLLVDINKAMESSWPLTEKPANLAIAVRYYDRDLRETKEFFLPETCDVLCVTLPDSTDMRGLHVNVNTDAVVLETHDGERLAVWEYATVIEDALLESQMGKA
jgi:hypothetical protein